jgi:hypothetical protein
MTAAHRTGFLRPGLNEERKSQATVAKKKLGFLAERKVTQVNSAAGIDNLEANHRIVDGIVNHPEVIDRPGVIDGIVGEADVQHIRLRVVLDVSSHKTSLAVAMPALAAAALES